MIINACCRPYKARKRERFGRLRRAEVGFSDTVNLVFWTFLKGSEATQDTSHLHSHQITEKDFDWLIKVNTYLIFGTLIKTMFF